jgi:hypothetical protein
MVDKCKAVIDSCTNKEQMRGAYNYLLLAGFKGTSLEEYFEIKLLSFTF